MRRFAEIDPVSGALRCVFDWPLADVAPAYQPGVAAAVEVTGLDPEPTDGWIYENGAWVSPPPPPEPEPAPVTEVV